MTVASTRITLVWSLMEGAEVATASFATAPTPSPTQGEMEDLALLASTLFLDEVWTPLVGYYPNETAFLGAQARTYDANNDLQASGESLLATPAPGTSTAVGLPLQTAIVVSLRTPIPGRRGRGRMYLPGPSVTHITNAGRLDADMQEVAVQSMRDFFDAWNADLNTLSVGVASQVGSFVTTVNSIRVGNVFDTQRRRRDELTEVYLSEDIA